MSATTAPPGILQRFPLKWATAALRGHELERLFLESRGKGWAIAAIALPRHRDARYGPNIGLGIELLFARHPRRPDRRRNRRAVQLGVRSIFRSTPDRRFCRTCRWPSH